MWTKQGGISQLANQLGRGGMLAYQLQAQQGVLWSLWRLNYQCGCIMAPQEACQLLTPNPAPHPAPSKPLTCMAQGA